MKYSNSVFKFDQMPRTTSLLNSKSYLVRRLSYIKLALGVLAVLESVGEVLAFVLDDTLELRPSSLDGFVPDVFLAS